MITLRRLLHYPVWVFWFVWAFVAIIKEAHRLHRKAHQK
jgi:hypothetical protein